MDYMPQWGNAVGQGTQDVSGMPVDDTMAQLQLKRKLAFADALRNAEMPQGQMVSGHYVAPSWTQQLANLYGKYQAGQEENKALKGYQDYLGSQRKIKQGAMTALANALKPKMVEAEQQPSTVTGSTGEIGPNMGMVNAPPRMVEPTQEDLYNAISEYANTTNQPDLAEKTLFSRITASLAPKQTEWKEVNGRLIGFDIHGRPTGEVLGEGKLPDYGTSANSGARALFGKDFKDLTQPEQKKVTDYVNQFKAIQANAAASNAASNAANTAFNTGGGGFNAPRPQGKTTSVAEVQDYAKKHNISYDAAAQHAASLGYTVQ